MILPRVSGSILALALSSLDGHPEVRFGLTWMAFFNLFPLGIVQLYHAVDTGYWHARSLDFLMLSWVNMLEWARLPGDAVFILGGALPLDESAARGS